MDFKGKVVVVTGAGSGIGKAVALKFASLGANLVISDINAESLKKVSDEVKVSKSTSGIVTHVGDVSNIESNKALVQLTISTFKRMDILINNAGIGAKDDIFASNLIENFDKIFSVNVRGLISLTHESIKHLIETKGNIVNVSSAAAFLSTEGMLSYTLSKAAVTRFTRSLAAELGAKGVRVNEVNPAFTRTNIFESTFNWSPEMESQVFDAAKQMMPIGNICEPEDIANSILFLANNDLAGKITGHSLTVDGGLIHRQVKM